MNRFYIQGGNPLCGEVKVQGAKNAVLPILAACAMNPGKVELRRCPDLKDVRAMIEILEYLGGKVFFEDHKIFIDGSDICATSIPADLMGKMRSSLFLLGPILVRCGQVKMSYPGGCAIGKRPIDLHMKALRQLGVQVKEEEDGIECKVEELKGSRVVLDFPSVGATENIMMLATAAKGTTQIINAAREPEILALQNFLNALGAKVSGAGSDVINIVNEGVNNDIVYDIIPDRIICGTLLGAGAITQGEILLQNCMPKHLSAELACFQQAGCHIKLGENQIYLKAPKRLKAIKHIITGPYPEFPTDMQSQFLAMMTLAQGESRITETIFENRFHNVMELKKMGADIKQEGNFVMVRGVAELNGKKVSASDLRGGAALVMAGLAASGETIIENIDHIYRGYEALEEVLSKVGANICRK